MCIYKESFDTIFNISYWSGKSPMDERIKRSGTGGMIFPPLCGFKVGGGGYLNYPPFCNSSCSFCRCFSISLCAFCVIQGFACYLIPEYRMFCSHQNRCVIKSISTKPGLVDTTVFHLGARANWNLLLIFLFLTSSMRLIASS